jgi:Uncharacterized protein involved in biosynthesis of c-type cytochromes
MQRFVHSLLLLLLTVSFLSAAPKPKMEDVASKLSCFCGGCPHLVVSQCGCSVADKIMADIQKKIDAGMSESEIINGYVAQYGATILSAPPKRGFDLTAWLLPFFAFFVGAGVLFTYLKRQRKEETTSPPESTPQDASREEDKQYRKQLERELEDRK